MSEITWCIMESRMISDAWYKSSEKQSDTGSIKRLKLEGKLVQAEDSIPRDSGKVVGKKFFESHKLWKWIFLLWNMKLQSLKHEINLNNI
jgi:hypothetical protein